MKVLRTSPLQQVNFRSIKGRLLIDMYQQLTAVIRARTQTPGAGDFLAKPIVNRRTGQLEWSTKLAGSDVEALTAVDEERRQQALQQLADLSGEIEAVARAFAESGDRSKAEDAALFEGILDSLSEDNIFLVDGRPVLVDWGVDVAGARRQPIELGSRVAAPADIPAPQDEPEPVPIPVVVEERSSRRWVLLPWLLALALILLLLLLFSDRWLHPPTLAGNVAPGAIEKEQELRKEIAALNSRLLSGVRACHPPEQPNAACEPSQVARPPSEIMLVLDTSRSMKWAIDVPESLSDEAFSLGNELAEIEKEIAAGNRSLRREKREIERQIEKVQNKIEQIPGLSRMSTAREIASDAVANAPQAINIGMVTFDQCEPHWHGVFPETRRPQLIDRIKTVDIENPTALAVAVEEAARRFVGGNEPDDPVNIVVLTDGSDSCKGDPCAVARAAKRAKPA